MCDLFTQKDEVDLPKDQIRKPGSVRKQQGGASKRKREKKKQKKKKKAAEQREAIQYVISIC